MRVRRGNEVADRSRNHDPAGPKEDEPLQAPLPDVPASVYEDLRALAHRILAWRTTDPRQHKTTSLVHEAYLRLAKRVSVHFRDRAHFNAVMAKAMRSILVDQARRYRAEKRGGNWRRIPLDEARLGTTEPPLDLVALNEALDELATHDDRKARVVELRVFGGCSVEETAEDLDVSLATVKYEWRFAKAWLYRKIRSPSLP